MYYELHPAPAIHSKDAVSRLNDEPAFCISRPNGHEQIFVSVFLLDFRITNPILQDTLSEDVKALKRSTSCCASASRPRGTPTRSGAVLYAVFRLLDGFKR